MLSPIVKSPDSVSKLSKYGGDAIGVAELGGRGRPGLEEVESAPEPMEVPLPRERGAGAVHRLPREFRAELVKLLVCDGCPAGAAGCV